MSTERVDLDAEAEVLLTRAEWWSARKKYLALAGRDDERAPPPVPAGYAWARRVTGFVNVDPLPQSSVLARGQVETPRTTIRWRLLFDDPASDAVLSPTTTRPATEADPVDRVVYPDPPGDVVTTQVYSRSTPPYFVGRPEEWIGRWLVNGIPRALALPRPVASYDDAEWRDTPWGRELAYAFVPTVVGGPHGGVAAVEPFGGELDTDVVLLRSPHPFLPASAIERQRAGDDVAEAGAVRTPVRSRAISYPASRYHSRRLTPSGWVGWRYRERKSGGVAGVLEDAWGAIEGALRGAASSVSGAARNLGKFATTGDLDALQAIAAAAAAVVATGGLGLGAAGTLLQASSVAGSDDPWRAAARAGAVSYAFYASPLTQAFRAGSFVAQPYAGSVTATESLGAVRAGATEITAKTYAVAGMTVSADDVAAAEVWAQRLVVMAPEQANAVLQWLATQGGYIDLVFARLVIEAEQDAEKRAALKARIAVQQAEWWRDYGRFIAAALSAVATALGAGAIAAAGFALLQALYQMGIQAATIESALDAQRRAELAADREVRAIEAEIARLEAEIAALGLAAPTATTTGAVVPVSTDAVSDRPMFRAWYAPIVDYWRGVSRPKS